MKSKSIRSFIFRQWMVLAHPVFEINMILKKVLLGRVLITHHTVYLLVFMMSYYIISLIKNQHIVYNYKQFYLVYHARKGKLGNSPLTAGVTMPQRSEKGVQPFYHFLLWRSNATKLMKLEMVKCQSNVQVFPLD